MNRLFLMGIAGILATGLAGSAQDADPKTGINMGQKAPAFQLKDQSGQVHSLDKLLTRGPVALVFFRSASW